jgi:biotin carboxyl carrier protein
MTNDTQHAINVIAKYNNLQSLKSLFKTDIVGDWINKLSDNDHKIIESYVDAFNAQHIEHRTFLINTNHEVEALVPLSEDENTTIKDIVVTDVGGEKVEVIDILVNIGDFVEEEEGIMTVETDKASMDITAQLEGEIVELTVTTKSFIKQGDVIGKIRVKNNS